MLKPLQQTPMVGKLLFSLSAVFPKLLYTNLGATQPRATEQNRTDISSIPRTCNLPLYYSCIKKQIFTTSLRLLQPYRHTLLDFTHLLARSISCNLVFLSLQVQDIWATGLFFRFLLCSLMATILQLYPTSLGKVLSFSAPLAGRGFACTPGRNRTLIL